MIVVKGQAKELHELTFAQKCEAFVKFHTTQALALFAGIYAFWQVVPDDVKADLLADMPWIAKYKTQIYVVSLALVFYKTKMGAQTIPVRPSAADAVPTDEPPPVQQP